MTTLDPSHIPGLNFTSDRTTGQAVHTSVPSTSVDSSSPSALKSLSERLAEADRKRRERRDSKSKAARRADDDGEDEESDDEDDARVPVPPIPDLRFEQGVLTSLRPFIHRTSALAPSASSAASSSTPPSANSTAAAPSAAHEKTAEAAEKQALATTSLTAEGPAQAGDAAAQVDVFDLTEGIRVEWGKVAYVLLRDQVVFPLLQGALWAVGGYYLSAAWSWNRARVDARSKGLPAPSLMRSLGIPARR
ncbi:hypothetical protein JCM10207_007882 [Rhodosporidiobolus poonsookiae]